MTKKFKFFVKESEVTPYSPLNHTGTVNRRLIGPKETGSEHLEVLLGVVSKSHGAMPHSHPDIDQVCYVIEGRAVAEIGGERDELGPGDACFFPANFPSYLHRGERRTGAGARHLYAALRREGCRHPRLGVTLKDILIGEARNNCRRLDRSRDMVATI